LDVAPVDVGEAAGVVVALAGQRRPPALLGRQVVPLVAGHLARLAADADGRIGEEAYGLGHVPVTPCSRCRRRPWPRGSLRSGRPPRRRGCCPRRRCSPPCSPSATAGRRGAPPCPP